MAATTATLLLGTSPAGATDLDCGDPGTFHNMPVPVGNDPHGLDSNGDGIGCEDASKFGPDGQPLTPTPTQPPATQPPVTAPPVTPPPAPAPTPVPAAPEAAPAAPVERQPTYTG